MTQKILRGRVLSFTRQPEGADDHGAYTYIEEGGILVSAGKIEASGPFDDLPTGIEVIVYSVQEHETDPDSTCNVKFSKGANTEKGFRVTT